MHFDTFPFIFRTLKADISASVSPRGLIPTLFESEGSSDSSKIHFNPLGLKGSDIKNGREKEKYRSACQP